MQEVKETALIEPGRRDRKRAETHARIQAAALELFLRQGFEATTLDQIAEAADVSRRSLFHYFASKEEMVLSAKADIAPLIRDAVAARPADEPLLAMAEQALIDMARHFQTPEAKAIARLIHDTPALAAWDAAKHDALERLLAEALAARKGLPLDDAELRVTALAAVAILRHATEAWLASDDRRGPEVFGKAAFQALRRVAAN